MSHQTEHHSKVEPFIINRICAPLLELVPRSVHPNTISLVTFVIVWATFLCAFFAWRFDSTAGRTLALLGAALGMFTAMVGDCLDGMQARRTNRCTKLGEVMDHWLDTIGAPLTTAGIALALQLPPFLVAPVHIANVMIYNSQLVLHHHTGRFVHPKISGTEAQLSMTFSYIGMAAFFFFFTPNTHPWVEWVIIGVGIISVIGCVQNISFFLPKLKGLLIYHFYFVILCGGFGALYRFEIIDTTAFLMCIVALSFRVNGSYVLGTLVKQSYNGFDFGLLAWIIGIGAAHFLMPAYTLAGADMHVYLPYLACLYVIVRNVIDVARHMPQIVPAKKLNESTNTA